MMIRGEAPLVLLNFCNCTEIERELDGKIAIPDGFFPYEHTIRAVGEHSINAIIMTKKEPPEIMVIQVCSI